MSRPLRILVATSMYPSASDPALGAFVPDQVRSLQAAGVDVDTFVIDPGKTRLNYGLKVAPLLRRLRSRRYDLVHTHHTYSLLTVLAAKRLAGVLVPIVLTSHENEITDPRHKTRTWHPSSYLRHALGFKRFVARGASFIILVNSQLDAVVPTRKKYEVIPCGIDLEKFKALDQRACRACLGIPLDAKVVFFPGRPWLDYKRFPLAQATFDMVRRRVPEAVLVTGGAARYDQMPLYFNASDVVLQTSFSEASPAVVKEALACEVPVVSTDAGDTREIIDGVPHCFICSPDPSELANRVLSSIGQRAVGGRERLRALGLSLDQVAARIITVYQRVA